MNFSSNKKFKKINKTNFLPRKNRSQSIGKTGEKVAEYYLKSIGAKCIEKIPTSIIVVNGKPIYNRKSSVDYTCALPSKNGYEPCRIEVKVCDDIKLVHSRLKPHQVQWLLDYVEIGFKSYVLWVHKSKCFLIQYPHSIFKKGKSISIQDIS